MSKYQVLSKREWEARSKHPYIHQTKRKPNQYMAAGYVWTPYIPITVTGSVIMGTPNVTQRYASKQVNSSYYGTFIISGSI